MERRWSSCAACSADRRTWRLLRGLRRGPAAARALPCRKASSFRASRRGIAAASDVERRAPICRLPRSCCFLQNHDQIGNRAFGERLTALAKPAALEAAIALQLLCPQIPLLFMGEELGSISPFQFFTDHTRISPRPCAKGAGANSPAFRNSQIRRGWRKFPIPTRSAPLSAREPEPNPVERQNLRSSIGVFVAPARRDRSSLSDTRALTPCGRNSSCDGALANGRWLSPYDWR